MRIFVGVELDERVKAAAAAAAEELRARLTRSRVGVLARWVEPENLHITVWFIGEVNDDRAAAVEQALQPRFESPAFDLHVRGCGAFPPSGPPRVFWLGVSAGTEQMTHVYEEVKARLVPLGFEAEKRAYSPHVTLARVKDIERAAARRMRDVLADVAADCGACRVAAVTLFRSHLSPRGSRYEPLLRVPLA